MCKNFLSVLIITILICQVGLNCKVSALDSVEPDTVKKQISLSTEPLAECEQSIKDFEHLMNNCINNNYVLNVKEVDSICDNFISCAKGEACLLKINTPTIIVGDIHGDIKSLEFCVKRFFNEIHNGKSILFLGDYVDRGKNSVECAALVLKLKTMFPDKVYVLRGNHEIKRVKNKHDREKYASSKYGFLKEVRRKYSNKDHVFKKINAAFDYLPIAAIVNNSLFCVHGGISPELKDLNVLKKLEKPISYERLSKSKNSKIKDLIMDLLWSDPNNVNDFEENIKRGRGKVFGIKQVNSFLNEFNLKHIIRGHQCVEGHDDKFKDGSIITVFSVPNYVGKTNKGSIMYYINEDNFFFVDII